MAAKWRWYFHNWNRNWWFRQYEIGLNVENKEDDFYEYMLTEMPGESEYMLLICVEGYKSGSLSSQNFGR